MLIVIDIGNSDAVFGVYTDNSWKHQWRIPSDRGGSTDSFREKIRDQLAHHNINRSDCKKIILSSVVPDLTPIIQDAIEEIFGFRPHTLGPYLYPGLRIKVVNTDEIGTDLVANAVAAFDRYETATIVVDFGTALTFTAIDSNGTLAGVAIAPGLRTAMQALFHSAAQLPEFPLNVPESVLGKNTTHALQAGILLGYVGLVESILDRIQEELDMKCRIIATGGLSRILTPLNRRFDEIDKMLTLDGLRIVAEGL
jgi:type III pantothenate kinase